MTAELQAVIDRVLACLNDFGKPDPADMRAAAPYIFRTRPPYAVRDVWYQR